MSTARAEHRDSAAGWRINTDPNVRGTFDGQAPPVSVPQKRVMSDRELKAHTRGRADGLVRGYLIGLLVGFLAGAVAVLLLVSLRGPVQ